MTKEQMEKGEEIQRKIYNREKLLERLNLSSMQLAYHTGSGFGCIRWGDDVDPGLNKYCLAMIRQSVTDDIERLRKEFEAL